MPPKWKRDDVVRIVLSEKQADNGDLNALIECLRYAGLVCTVGHSPSGALAFDLVPPKGVDTKTWAHMNAERIRTFGFNAVAAPETAPYPSTPEEG